MIGNAFIDFEDELKGSYEYLWSHALISDELHEGIVSYCNFSSVSEVCNAHIDQADDARGNVFMYNIYAPLCSMSSNIPSISEFDPCSENYIYSYLNTPEVQKALHANVTGISGPWESCNFDVGINWKDMPETVLPTIKELMGSGISIWLYSGDTDGAVPVITTKYSINKLGPSVKTSWYPWYSGDEVGGYAVEYQNLTFVTIRGAGHFVPSYQPERALTFFSSFLEGKLPPRHN